MQMLIFIFEEYIYIIIFIVIAYYLFIIFVITFRFHFQAYRVCEEHKLYRETVFILSRMGNTKQALALLVEEIRDYVEAVNFVKEVIIVVC